MKITLYTTSESSWYKNEAKFVEKAYAPYLPLTFDVVKVAVPMNPQFMIDNSGDKVFDWNWFSKTFPKVADGVGFHFGEKQANKWGITIGGQRNSKNKTYPEFWITSGTEKAHGYPFSSFIRKLFHELAHFGEDADNDTGNKLNQASVHHWDYDLKKIHKYHELIDFSLYKQTEVSRLQGVLAYLVDKLKNLMPTEKPTPFFSKPYPTTQAFGVKNRLYRTGIHIGTDFGCPIGTPILAPLSGDIIEIGHLPQVGNYCLLKTRLGTYRLCHLSSGAKKGRFEQGQTIAFSGNTGMSTGPHLHVELWVKPVDVTKLTKDNVFTYLINPIQ